MIYHKKNAVENNLLGNRFSPVRTISSVFVDKLLRRRGHHLRTAFRKLFNGQTPYFHQVHIETCSFCNHDCHFCPANRNHDTRGKYFMGMDVVRSLISNLKRIGFNGLISLFNNNEPLLDKRLPELIKLFKQEIPKARIEIFTNGILLDIKQAEELWDAGLDSLLIENFVGDTSGEKRLKKFLDDFEKSEYSKIHSVTINHLKCTIIRSNRGGNAPNKPQRIKPLHAFCPMPFTQFSVNYRGDVQLCCNDVYYEQIMGNILKESIEDIWNSREYQRVRSYLMDCRRDYGICRSCDTMVVLRQDRQIIHQRGNNQIIIPRLIYNGVTFDIDGDREIYTVSVL